MQTFLCAFLLSSGITTASSSSIKYQSGKYTWTPLETFQSVNGIGECAKICRRSFCFGFAFDGAARVCETGNKPSEEDPNGREVYKFEPGDCRSDVAKQHGYIFKNDRWWAALPDEVSSWAEAMDRCLESGGNLAYFSTRKYCEAVEHALSDLGPHEYFWSGLVLDQTNNRPCDNNNDPADCDGVFKFGANTTLEWGPHEWSPRLLSRSSGPGFCGVIHRSPTTGNLIIEDQSCDWDTDQGKNRPLCQIDCYYNAKNEL